MRLFLPVCTAVDHHLAKALQPLPNSGMRELYPVQVWLSAATCSHLCMSPQRAQTWVFHVVSWLRRISPHVSKNLHLLVLQTLQCLRDTLGSWRGGHCSLDPSLGLVHCLSVLTPLSLMVHLDTTSSGLELLEGQMQEKQWIECFVNLEPRWISVKWIIEESWSVCSQVCLRWCFKFKHTSSLHISCTYNLECWFSGVRTPTFPYLIRQTQRINLGQP